MLKNEKAIPETTAENLDLNSLFFKRTETDMGMLEAELETISRLLNVFYDWFDRCGRISELDRNDAAQHELDSFWNEAVIYDAVLFTALKNVKELCKEMNDLYEKLDG